MVCILAVPTPNSHSHILSDHCFPFCIHHHIHMSKIHHLNTHLFFLSVLHFLELLEEHIHFHQCTLDCQTIHYSCRSIPPTTIH
uniref:Uncharacterized protein n=1 Tax=Anguilla anguilla TaxID=7936 RepID=A0A0E9XZC6_ANGAN